MPADVMALLRQAERRKGDRSTAESRWEELATFLAPEQRGFTGEPSKDGARMERIYDSDPLDAVEIFTSALYGALTPASAEWFAYQTPEDEVNAEDEAAEYLERATTQTHLHLAQSNWTSQITAVYRDAIVFGNGAILIELARRQGPWFPGFRFYAIPLQALCLAQNGEGKIDTADRWLSLTAREAKESWPQGTLSAEVLKAVETEPEKRFQFLHMIFPRKGGRPGAVGAGKPFASVILEVAKKSLVWESGYEEFPVAVWRWTRQPQAVYAYGPGSRALPDVKTLNDAIRMDLEAWGKVINPPTFFDDNSVIGTVRNGSGGLNWLRPSARPPIPWVSGARFDVTQVKAEELRKKIRRTLYAAFLELPEGDPEKTATEMLIRREEADKTLAPAVGNAETELLGPATERMFAMQYREGVFGEVPDALDQVEVQAKFQGPLARVQRMPDVVAIRNFRAGLLERATALGQPDLLDLIDDDKADRLEARITGVPASVIRGERELAQIREARQAAKAEEAETREAERAAGIVQQTAPMAKALMPGPAQAGAGA